ncbi:hypothetical protein HDU96_003955 [Phlyctochytrium bullatum]|nr:hypothetical protein HDU96_003955 [Phlyctochytrium bullatum]
MRTDSNNPPTTNIASADDRIHTPDSRLRQVAPQPSTATSSGTGHLRNPTSVRPPSNHGGMVGAPKPFTLPAPGGVKPWAKRLSAGTAPGSARSEPPAAAPPTFASPPSRLVSSGGTPAQRAGFSANAEDHPSPLNHKFEGSAAAGERSELTAMRRPFDHLSSNRADAAKTTSTSLASETNATTAFSSTSRTNGLTHTSNGSPRNLATINPTAPALPAQSNQPADRGKPSGHLMGQPWAASRGRGGLRNAARASISVSALHAARGGQAKPFDLADEIEPTPMSTGGGGVGPSGSFAGSGVGTGGLRSVAAAASSSATTAFGRGATARPFDLADEMEGAPSGGVGLGGRGAPASSGARAGQQQQWPRSPFAEPGGKTTSFRQPSGISPASAARVSGAHGGDQPASDDAANRAPLNSTGSRNSAHTAAGDPSDWNWSGHWNRRPKPAPVEPPFGARLSGLAGALNPKPLGDTKVGPGGVGGAFESPKPKNSTNAIDPGSGRRRLTLAPDKAMTNTFGGKVMGNNVGVDSQALPTRGTSATFPHAQRVSGPASSRTPATFTTRPGSKKDDIAEFDDDDDDDLDAFALFNMDVGDRDPKVASGGTVRRGKTYATRLDALFDSSDPSDSEGAEQPTSGARNGGALGAARNNGPAAGVGRDGVPSRSGLSGAGPTRPGVDAKSQRQAGFSEWPSSSGLFGLAEDPPGFSRVEPVRSTANKNPRSSFGLAEEPPRPASSRVEPSRFVSSRGVPSSAATGAPVGGSSIKKPLPPATADRPSPTQTRLGLDKLFDTPPAPPRPSQPKPGGTYQLPIAAFFDPAPKHKPKTPTEEDEFAWFSDEEIENAIRMAATPAALRKVTPAKAGESVGGGGGGVGSARKGVAGGGLGGGALSSVGGAAKPAVVSVEDDMDGFDDTIAVLDDDVGDGAAELSRPPTPKMKPAFPKPLTPKMTTDALRPAVRNGIDGSNGVTGLLRGATPAKAGDRVRGLTVGGLGGFGSGKKGVSGSGLGGGAGSRVGVEKPVVVAVDDDDMWDIEDAVMPGVVRETTPAKTGVSGARGFGSATKEGNLSAFGGGSGSRAGVAEKVVVAVDDDMERFEETSARKLTPAKAGMPGDGARGVGSATKGGSESRFGSGSGSRAGVAPKPAVVSVEDDMDAFDDTIAVMDNDGDVIGNVGGATELPRPPTPNMKTGLPKPSPPRQPTLNTKTDVARPQTPKKAAESPRPALPILKGGEAGVDPLPDEDDDDPTIDPAMFEDKPAAPDTDDEVVPASPPQAPVRGPPTPSFSRPTMASGPGGGLVTDGMAAKRVLPAEDRVGQGRVDAEGFAVPEPPKRVRREAEEEEPRWPTEEEFEGRLGELVGGGRWPETVVVKCELERMMGGVERKWPLQLVVAEGEEERFWRWEAEVAPRP